MPGSETNPDAACNLERLRRLEDRVEQFEAFRRKVAPLLSALEQLVDDADYGRRKRLEREHRVALGLKMVAAAAAGATLLASLLSAFHHPF